MRCTKNNRESFTVSRVVMCDNDFTIISIIMVFMSRYDNYHDSKSK